MGFSDLGRSILGNNDRLRKRIRNKYFGKSRNQKENPKFNDGEDRQYLPKVEYTGKEGDYRHLNWANIITAALIVLLTILAYVAFDKFFGEVHGDYLTNLESINDEKIGREYIEAYKQHIDKGYSYLENNQYDRAQWAFTEALNLYENGKAANYGMTMTLIYQCIINNEYCEQSETYFYQLDRSRAFTSQEIRELERIKNEE